MPSQRLSNYLRKFRKLSGLSQEDVAFLLGAQTGAKVCRYERFIRSPGLETALALEVIFKRSVAELFPGLFQRIERGVRDRAGRLAKRKSSADSTRFGVRKHQTLHGIVSSQARSKSQQS